MKNIISSLFLVSALSMTGCGGSGSSSGGSSGGGSAGGGNDLSFTLDELNDTYLISEDSLEYDDDAMIYRFDKGEKLPWIDYGNNEALGISTKHDWDVKDGKIEVEITINGAPAKCTLKKTAKADGVSVNATVSCDGEDDYSKKFLKPQPFSVDRLEGKEITYKNANGITSTLTFGDKTYTDDSREIEDAPTKYRAGPKDRSVWLNTDEDEDLDENVYGAILLLAEGTIDNGTLVWMYYSEGNFLGLDIVKTDGDKWTAKDR